MDKKKPILLVDFDGVIHSYVSGWQGADVVSDLPVPGAFEFLYAATAWFHVNIYSSRTRQPGGILAMQNWFAMHEHPDADLVPSDWWKDLYFPEQKPAAFLTIDDRCVCFSGEFPDPEKLLDFKPWNKRDI